MSYKLLDFKNHPSRFFFISVIDHFAYLSA